MRHQTSTFKMADPAGTKTVEEAKKSRTVPDPARETDLVVLDTRRNPEEAKKEQNHGLCHTLKGCPGRSEGDRQFDGGLPEDFGNCMKISMFYHFQCIGSYCPLFCRFMMVQVLLDPCFAHFKSYSQN